MQRYLGVDVHGESCTFSVLSASGREVQRQVVETNGQALVGYLRQLPGTLHLCLVSCLRTARRCLPASAHRWRCGATGSPSRPRNADR